MCGIVGVVDFRSDVDRETIRKAAGTLRFRGPDDSGVWTSGNVGLGHQRLSVIDLSSSGHQPMMSADGRYVIVYNGEIYNFLEIREELSDDGEQWHSATDTEVIIRSYERWGPRCVERFHGMFAFAIWDRDSRAMFSARDRMGVKPYYYHYSSNCFAFASRPRALLSLNRNWSDPLDEQALRFYMEGGYIPAPYSAFKQIRKLPPAHWLLIDSTGIHLQRYWDFRQITPESSWEHRSEDDLLDELDDILTRSIKSRMTSDVPLGAFLSGGIDSSLVVAIMAKQSTKPVKTFTIGFEAKAYDESPFAEAVSQKIGSEHFCEVMNIGDLLRLRPTFSLEFDEPFFDSSAFPTMAVSCLARKHVTVSLSGDGGDELFGGYHYYQLARRLETFYRLPRAIRGAIASAVAISPKHRMKLLSAAMRQRNSTDAFCFARSIAKDFNPVLDPDILRRTISLNELFAEAARPFPSNLKTPEIAMRLDSFYTLPDDYLQKVDVASMAFSLESREPLLDQDVVEWAMKLPLKWKLRAGQNKYLLRKLAYRYLPRELLDRPKQGFEVPVADWIRGPLQEWAMSELSDCQNFANIPLSQTRLLELFRIHNSGDRQAHSILWAALIYLDFVHGLPDPYGELAPASSTVDFRKPQTTRILINALSARRGGGQTYLINLLERFPTDFTAEVYVLAPESLELPSNGSNIKRISAEWAVENPFARAVWEKLHLSKLASRLGASILFCPGGIVGTRPPRGCKSVTMFRNMIPFNSNVRQKYRLGYMKFRNFLLRRSLLESMAHADLVIFLSDYAKGVIEREVRGKLANAVTIPHGVAPAFRDKARTNPAASHANRWPEGYFLYVSTLDYYKAQVEVVRAYALLKQKRSTPEKLILAGPEYPQYGRLVREEITKLALENDVVITGALSHSDMPALYRNAVLNIFASECENCPNILIEALASGRPVFSSSYAPMPEFAGEAAVYFDPKSPRDLAEKLAATLADPIRMQDLAEKAEKQSQHYDWELSAHKTWRLIHELAQS